jgi:hypothetical protein
MDNSTIEQINKIFKTKKLTWCGNFLRYDENANQDCYDFTFQIDKVKPMISVGEWKDHALVEVTLHIDPKTILGKLVSGEYKDIWGDSEQLLRFYPIKNGTADKITKALKLVSDLNVIVTSIKPVLVSDDKIVETIMEQRTNRSVIRDIVRNISFELKKDLHGTRLKKIGPFDLGYDEPIDVEVYINYPRIIDPTKKKRKKNRELLKPYNVDGEWEDDFYSVRIEIDIDKQADLSIMYDLIGELNDVVTHELEHVNQSKQGFEFPEKEYDQDKRYYLQQHEIEAQVVGFKRKSKLQKRPIEEVIREYFERRNVRKSLINLFVERLMEHYNAFN